MRESLSDVIRKFVKNNDVDVSELCEALSALHHALEASVYELHARGE